MTDFKFPDAASRVSTVGATGSGKTRFSAWLFAHSSFRSRPYTILDYKGDDLIAQIPYAHEIDLNKVPKHPGLYIARPTPHESEAVDEFLWKLWERGNSGLFVDEGYMIGKFSKPFNAILTQGRSKKIPTFINTQRPVDCSRFVFSEASYCAAFRLSDVRDEKTIEGYTPFDFSSPLQPYHARWYDVARDWNAIIKPVPDDGEILDIYETALKPKKRSI